MIRSDPDDLFGHCRSPSADPSGRTQVGAVASPGPAATAGSAGATGSDLASLLTDAMNSQTGVDAGNIADASNTNDAGPSTTGPPDELSILLGEASALTASNGPSAFDPTSSTSGALASLISGLTTARSTSPDISSLRSSLIGAASGTGASASPDLSSLVAGLTGTGATDLNPTARAPNVTTQTCSTLR